MSQTLFQSKFNRMQMPVRSCIGGASAVAFCLALTAANAGCVKLPRHARTATANDVQQGASTTVRVNINTATLAELERLPGIGAGLATRIIAHRTRYGPFRRIEHLLIIPGISERRFAELRPFISTE